MAHCDARMSDLVNLPPPVGNIVEIWHNNDGPGEMAGSYLGPGCSGNGTIAACTYQGPSRNLVVYDYDGNRLWNSGDDLNSSAFSSVPLIDDQGNIYACDDTNLIKYDPNGNIIFRSVYPTPGSGPVSPVLTKNGAIVFSTMGGPIYAYNSMDGSLIGELFIRIDESDSGFFESFNTVAVRRNRVYAVLQHIDDETLGWLAAIDVNPNALRPSNRFKMVWHYEFGGPSGASPLVIGDTIYFDGERGKPFTPVEEKETHVYAVMDVEEQPIELFKLGTSLGGEFVIKASFARDPRGDGFWSFIQLRPFLEKRDLLTGQVILDSQINLNQLIGEPGTFHFPTSIMTMTGDANRPVMIVSASPIAQGNRYVVAVDLASQSLLWKFRVSTTSENSAGQFPILMRDGRPRIVFSTLNTGARAIGAAP